jgi:C4-dicarboxylate transporter DctM subunit
MRECVEENADIVKALGGAPVTMPITETYDALQKGLAEGILLPNEALKGWKFAEVVIIMVYLIGGSFIDDLAFMILATPIFYPAVIKLGYDPIWFGIMIGITIMIGVIIPPVAICVFIVRNITGIPFNVIYKGVLPFLLALVACAILLFFFPQIATWLPDLFMGVSTG